ncbi:MAG: septum site-determining protein MinD [Selenomonadaceae bacterium]|nr:septum site-determining protein MinD [Selenomonadaceae bacterium]
MSGNKTRAEIIVITSGKGGVGKTTTTANIGVGLAMKDKKVALIDTDTGLRNLDLLLGLENRIMYDLVDVTEGRVPYKKALVPHKKFRNLFLLPTSQVKDKSSVNPEALMKLCDEMKSEFDYILIDCPAGIEQGFQTAIAGADCAIVVTMPEISAVRDADKIIGELGRADKDNIKLIVNRIRPQMVEQGDMLDMKDINDILSITCIGQVPDDEKVVTSTNRGEPVIMTEDSLAGRAYKNIVRRILGEDVEFMDLHKDTFLRRLKRAFGMN